MPIICFEFLFKTNNKLVSQMLTGSAVDQGWWTRNVASTRVQAPWGGGPASVSARQHFRRHSTCRYLHFCPCLLLLSLFVCFAPAHVSQMQSGCLTASRIPLSALRGLWDQWLNLLLIHEEVLIFAYFGFLTFAPQVLSMCPALIGCHLSVHVISITLP